MRIYEADQIFARSLRELRMDTNPSIVVIINFTPSISLVIVALYSDTVPQSVYLI